jgi:hypothetical protein
MRILLVGSFKNGRLAASYEHAFASLGHSVVRFDIDISHQYLRSWLRSRLVHRLTINSLSARRLGSIRYNQHLCELVHQERPQIVLVFNGFFIMPSTAHRVRELGSKFILFHADNPLRPHYNYRPETLLLGRASDLFLIWSSALAHKLAENGFPASFLPFGWDPHYTPYTGYHSDAIYDISFVGGWDRKRELFLEEVSKYFNLKIWGPPYWRSRTRIGSRVRDCWQGSAISGATLADVYARSKINLNILRDQHHIDGTASGVIMRTFEAPGAGGFLLSTRSTDATHFFPESMSGAFFGDISECLGKIDYYLEHHSCRREIAESAHALVDKNHHYSHRAAEILDMCSS